MTFEAINEYESTTLAPTIVTFGVSDPEVLLALSAYPEGSEKTQFLTTALKVGVMALKAARGSVDGDAVRREGDRLMSDLSSRLNSWHAGFEERISGSLARISIRRTGSSWTGSTG